MLYKVSNHYINENLILKLGEGSYRGCTLNFPFVFWYRCQVRCRYMMVGRWRLHSLKYMPLCMKFLNAKIIRNRWEWSDRSKLWLPAEGFDVGHISTFFDPGILYIALKKWDGGLVKAYIQLQTEQRCTSPKPRAPASVGLLVPGVHWTESNFWRMLCDCISQQIKIWFESCIKLTRWESIETSH